MMIHATDIRDEINEIEIRNQIRVKLELLSESKLK